MVKITTDPVDIKRLSSPSVTAHGCDFRELIMCIVIIILRNFFLMSPKFRINLGAQLQQHPFFLVSDTHASVARRRRENPHGWGVGEAENRATL